MITRISLPLTWHTSLIIIDFLDTIVFAYILNRCKGHWLLNNALNFVISMSLKSKDKIDFAPFDNLMKKNANVVFEL